MKMQAWRRILLLLFLFLLAGLFASLVFGDQDDPPGRVARLSLAQGKVSFQPSGETSWSEASVNRPITTGDRLYTDQGARAELEVGPFAVRLSQGTDVTLANLNDQLMQLGVGQGTLRVTVYEMPEGSSMEVVTPNGALIIQAAGSYRVDTAADGNSTQVTVNAGTLQISAGDLSKTVQSGQAVHLTGTGPVMAASLSVPPPDDFDNWCAGRDQRIEKSASAQQVGPAVPGGEDLDTYGQWANEPGYGQVWYPSNVPPGWVPYRNGHWVYVRPWGWTWVEAEPWGYAPFHYGRWARIRRVWAWVPGPVMRRPVYAPALVGFVGGRGMGGVGVQAWFPLGPQEPFMPWYHHGPTYMNEINVVKVTNASNVHYMNREAAVTAVSGDVFRGGQPVASGMVHVSPEQLAHAEVNPHMEVSPTSQAVFGAGAVAAPPVRAERVMGMGPAAPSGLRTTAPEPHEAPRTGGPPNTPSPHVFTRNGPALMNNPPASRPEANSSLPRRPMEPQPVNNVQVGKPSGPAPDKAVVPPPAKPPAPVPAKATPKPKTPPPRDTHEHH